eukprot:13913403-Ditylum_brightwellii.AAC.1
MESLCSVSGYILFRNGGPIAWGSECQPCTAQSSCEADFMWDLDLPDFHKPTPVYNDNRACMDWCHSSSNKGMRHIDMKENLICECVHHGDLRVEHIQGKLNLSDLMTKEHKDVSLFLAMRDCVVPLP